MRLHKRILCLVLAVIMLLPLCGCGLIGLDPEMKAYFRNGGVTFPEMEYVRPETDGLFAEAEVIFALLDEGASLRKTARALSDFYELYWHFYSQYTLASIRSDIDTSDEFYSEEYAYCQDAAADIDNLFDDIMVACAKSDLAYDLNWQYFNGFLSERYNDDYIKNIEEIKALKEEEAELLAEYRSLTVELTDAISEVVTDDEALDLYKEYDPQIAQLFIELVKLRNQLADLMGYDSYEEYAYSDFARDYDPEDLDEYLAAVKEYILPVYLEATEKGLVDTMYDELYAIGPEESLELIADTVSGMDEMFENAMDYMLKNELYDIGNGRHKMQNSYQMYIEDYNSPFLFSYTLGYEEDILSIAHEFGHYTDAFINYDTDSCLDTSETMSQGLEYLLLCYLEDKEQAEALTKCKMLDTLQLFSDQVCFNEFERCVFALSEEELTVDNVNSIFGELATEYGFDELYGDYIDYMWIDIVHLFEYPFYVISYCVSASAAFMLYTHELNEPGTGLAEYLSILQDAPNYDFLEQFEKKELDSPISESAVRLIADTVYDMLGLEFIDDEGTLAV